MTNFKDLDFLVESPSEKLIQVKSYFDNWKYKVGKSTLKLYKNITKILKLMEL